MEANVPNDREISEVAMVLDAAFNHLRKCPYATDNEKVAASKAIEWLSQAIIQIRRKYQKEIQDAQD